MQTYHQSLTYWPCSNAVYLLSLETTRLGYSHRESGEYNSAAYHPRILENLIEIERSERHARDAQRYSQISIIYA